MMARVFLKVRLCGMLGVRRADVLPGEWAGLPGVGDQSRQRTAFD